jgi:hypothetical protein
MDFIFILIGIAMLAALIWAVATGKLKSNGPGGAALTAMHDVLPQDKQAAIEIVMEQKAGKKWEEQESGEGETERENNNESE